MKEVIILSLLIFGVTIVIGVLYCVLNPKTREARQKRIEAEKSGALMKRDPYFYKDMEIFTAQIRDFNAFCTAMTAAVSKTQVCSFSGDYNGKVVYLGTKISWSVVLERLPSNDGFVRYSLGMEEYRQTQLSDAANVMALANDLNYLFTAIERTFLSFDPNTKVAKEAIQFKHRSSLF